MATKTNKKPSVPKRKVLSFEKFVDTINNAPLLMQAVDDMFNKFADELDEKEIITPNERKATTDNRRDTGTGQQSASRQTPTGQGREE